jgi:hypothetical protein
VVSTSDLETYGVLLAVFALIVGRRVVRMVQGAPLSIGRLMAFAAVYLALCALALGADLLIEPWWVGLVDAALIVGIALSLPSAIESSVSVYRGPGGGWYFKMGVWVPVVYLALFITRIVIEIGVLGIDPFAYSPFSVTFSTEQLTLLAIVDGLFAVSTGLLVARSVAVYRSFHRAQASEAHGAATPLP